MCSAHDDLKKNEANQAASQFVMTPPNNADGFDVPHRIFIRLSYHQQPYWITIFRQLYAPIYPTASVWKLFSQLNIRSLVTVNAFILFQFVWKWNFVLMNYQLPKAMERIKTELYCDKRGTKLFHSKRKPLFYAHIIYAESSWSFVCTFLSSKRNSVKKAKNKLHFNIRDKRFIPI